MCILIAMGKIIVNNITDNFDSNNYAVYYEIMLIFQLLPNLFCLKMPIFSSGTLFFFESNLVKN